MKLTKKQEEYINLCELIVPYLRNIQTYSVFKRLSYGSIYRELELIHNLHRLIVDPEITDADIHWFNSQVFQFLKNLKVEKGIGLDKHVILSLGRIINLFSQEQRMEIHSDVIVMIEDYMTSNDGE